MNQQHPQQQQTETTTSIGYSLRPRKQKQVTRDTQQQQPTRPNRNNFNFNDNNFNNDRDDDDDDGVESDDGSQQKKAKREATNQLNKNNNNNNNNKWWQSGFLKYYSFHEVPRYMQDNEDIHGHYRAFYSYKENWISLFHLHNESVNVWNHLIGGFISIVWGLCALYGITIRTLNFADPMDRIMILLHCLASAFTFFTSGLYHLHLSHSYEAYNWWGCWDYAGISAQIGGATVALLYYLFYCETGLRTMWATLVLCFSSVGVIGPYFSFWPTAKFRPIRSAIYVASAVVSGGPVFHFLWLHGWSALPKNGAVELMGLSLSCYLIGVVFYVSRFPESVWPGKFDLWFASHQIWHSLVVAAVFFHFHVVFGLIEWRHELGVCESQS